MTDTQNLRITASPHVHHPDSTSKIMWNVAAALLPAALWGVYVFGFHAAAVLFVSLAAAVLSEFVINRVLKRSTLHDGSAWITGLLIGMNMPPEVPLGVPVVASIFAIVVVKWTFGGLGRNWMNPALAGRVFVFFSWTGAMSTWKTPGTNITDGLSGATPLGAVKTALMDASEGISGPMSLLKSVGYNPSFFDVRLSSIFRTMGLPVEDGYIDLFFGNIGGCIGEISGFLLVLGGLYLLIRRYANWQIVVSYFFSFVLCIGVFGGLPFTGRLFTGDIAFHLFSGGFFLGLFFMSTDMVSSPITPKGMFVYGSSIGLLTFLIRVYGSFPEGVSLAILLMNIATPWIDRLTQPRIFGTGKQGEVR